MHNTHKKGAVSEYRAATWFSSQGWEVYWSNLGQSTVDFIITPEGEMKTVQVKTAFAVPSHEPCRYLRINLAHGNKKRKLYRDGMFDILAACSAGGLIWIIPIEHLPQDVTQLTLWNHQKDTEYTKWLVTNLV